MTPDEYMARAERAIKSAKLLLTDGDFIGAVNRAYYAMFDAAHASLLRTSVQIDPAITKTHRGLIAAVGQHLVKPGIFPAEYGRSLNRVERLRLVGDYTGETVNTEQAAWAITEAEAFLLAAQRQNRISKLNQNQ